MNIGKNFTLSLLVLTLFFAKANCQINDNVYLKFLDKEINEKANKGEVTIVENCEEKAVFFNTRSKVTPPVIQKGGLMDIKVVGQSSKKDKLDNLTIIAFLNGTEVFKDSRPMKKDIEPGINIVYSYEYSLPTFIPEGKFEIFVKLVNENKDNLSCLKASFYF